MYEKNSKSVLSTVGGVKPSLTQFSMDYNYRSNCDWGEIIPTYLQEVLPGDIINIGQQQMTRLNPLVFPYMDNIVMTTRYFEVPYRILWDEWASFIMGMWENKYPPEEYVGKPPVWIPTNNNKYSLWDYFGFPVGVDPKGAYPVDFPRRAYNLIYNYYYRNENFNDYVKEDNEEILKANWADDYFTTCLPSQQQGTPPSVELTGQLSAVWEKAKTDWDRIAQLQIGTGNPAASDNWVGLALRQANPTTEYRLTGPNGTTGGSLNFKGLIGIDTDVPDPQNVEKRLSVGGVPARSFREYLNDNKIDLARLATFDTNDLRAMVQVQRWLERNNRSGNMRYTEALKAHWGISPSEQVLQMPNYLGTIKSDIMITEVLQTSATENTSPQGNMAGHGISISEGSIGTHQTKEFGLIIGLTTIGTEASYGQGIPAEWRRYSRLEQVMPEFVHLSEKAVLKSELYATDNETQNNDVFGFQPMYQECRIRNNVNTGDMRDKLSFMSSYRKFGNQPALNADFLKYDNTKDIFAVQAEPAFLLRVYNKIMMKRPLPFMSEPGELDHI